MLLKDRPGKAINGESSDTLYIRGFPRTETDESAIKLLSVFAPPIEYDLSARLKSGEVWSRYDDANTACKTIQMLHHRSVNGSILSVKYELGLDVNGKRIVDRSSHTTIIRRIAPRKEGESVPTKKQKVDISCVLCFSPASMNLKGQCNCSNPGSQKPLTNRSCYKSAVTVPGVSYTSNSICVNEMEYPFPSGMYLARIIELTNRLSSRTNSTPTSGMVADTAAVLDPLLAILTDTKSMGNKYAKEISEAMAMVDAIQRAVSLLPPEYKTIATSTHSPSTTNSSIPQHDRGVHERPMPANTNQVRVFVLGDGKRPLCAAAACLHLPEHYSFYSVDPLMMPMYSCAVALSDTNGQIITPCAHFGPYQNRFFPLALMSQGFQVPAFTTTTNNDTDSSVARALSIVISCHSHAPLQEFWERLPGPKVAITMACCADYAALFAPVCSSIAIELEPHTSMETEDLARNIKVGQSQPEGPKRAGKRGKDELLRKPLVPVLEFDDFEVYSPKRAVKIYFDL